MPRVPTYDTPEVAPQGGPAPYRQPAAVDNLDSARQNAAAGAALQDAGTQLTQEEVNAQAMANQVMVDGARNSFIESQQKEMYDPDNGVLSKKGAAALAPDPLGRSLAQRYSEEQQDKINELAAGLGNDAQRRVFLQQVAPLATQFSGDVQRHMLQEHFNYGEEAQQGAIRLAVNQAKLDWSDRGRVAQQIEIASRAVWMAGQLRGEPGTLTAANMQSTASAIHTGVIQAALDHENPTYAQQYLQDNKGAMTADDLLRADGLVNHSMDGFKALGAVNTATAKLSAQIQPTDMDRLTNIVRGMESGGRETNADGTPLTSSKGATGSMQVMAATAANPGFGVAPPKDNSPAALADFGRRYLAGLVAHYGGPAQAMAAYNAGPGKLDDAIAAAKKAGAPQNWLTYLPQETQAYVQKGMTKFGAGGGAQPFPTESQFVQTAVDALGDNPRIEQVQLTRQQASAQYAMLDKSRREQGDQAVMRAQQELVQNGGNMAGLAPQTRADVIRFAPGQYDNLMDFGKKIATGGTATNFPAYLDAVANKDELAKMPQSTFNDFIVRNFSPEDGKHIAALRQDAIDGKDDQSAGGLNRPALNTALNSRLEAIGINPAPKDLNEKARVGSIQKFVTDGIFAQQKQLGRKMTAQEVSDFVDQTMSRNVTFRTTYLGIIPGGTDQKNMMAMKKDDIPSESLNQILAAFAARGNNRPTDDQILRTYWTSKNAK